MTHRALIRTALIPAAATLLFACGGSHSTPAGQAPAPASPGGGAAMSAAPAASGLPANVTAQMVAEGDSIFNAPRSCNGCHGKGGTNGRNGPDLTTGKYGHVDGSYASIVRVITNGVPKEEIKDPAHRFPMRARGGHDLTDAQIASVAAYVWSLAHK